MKPTEPVSGSDLQQAVQFRRLVARFQERFQFIGMVEMILDHLLAAPGDEHELLDAGFAGLFDRVLDHRLVHDRQHFLGHRLGGRKEARPHAGDGKNGFANRLCDRHVDAFRNILFHGMGLRLMSSFPRIAGKSGGGKACG